jgi:hypothetical protein
VDAFDADLVVTTRLTFMSARLDPSWFVLASRESADGLRCVDTFRRPDGSFGFEEFRRDPEDMGVWTPVAYFSSAAYASRVVADAAAERAVSWLSPDGV